MCPLPPSWPKLDGPRPAAVTPTAREVTGDWTVDVEPEPCIICRDPVGPAALRGEPEFDRQIGNSALPALPSMAAIPPPLEEAPSPAMVLLLPSVVECCCCCRPLAEVLPAPPTYKPFPRELTPRRPARMLSGALCGWAPLSAVPEVALPHAPAFRRTPQREPTGLSCRPRAVTSQFLAPKGLLAALPQRAGRDKEVGVAPVSNIAPDPRRSGRSGEGPPF